jgi:hypothetical protein
LFSGREITKNDGKPCKKQKKELHEEMEMKTYQPLNCPLCGIELLSTENLRNLTQAVGEKVGVGKTMLFCEECNTRIGILIVSDAKEWLLFVVPVAYLDHGFELLIQLRENFGWAIEKIKKTMEQYLPKALS